MPDVLTEVIRTLINKHIIYRTNKMAPVQLTYRAETPGLLALLWNTEILHSVKLGGSCKSNRLSFKSTYR